MVHLSVSAPARAALAGVLASAGATNEKVVLQDIITALQTNPPPEWVASLVPFSAEVIMGIEFILEIQSLLPNQTVVPVPTSVSST